MSPVPAKTLRLSELDEKDRTAYFSVTALMERGKAVAARSGPPNAAEPAPNAAAPEEVARVEERPPTLPLQPSVLSQLREASPARKATLVVLPLLIGLLLLKPVFVTEPEPTGTTAVTASRTEPVPTPKSAESSLPFAAPTPDSPPVLPKGLTWERAASDALAAGDFARALGFYRELSRRDPENAAYREAARILETRVPPRQP